MLGLQGHDLAHHGDMAAALFNSGDKFLLMAAPLALRSQVLQALFSWAVKAIGLREGDPVRAAASLLAHMIAPPDSMAACRQASR